MNSTTGERLYQLLPAIYRQRDAAAGEPLRALLAVIESELRLLERDIAGLYDNWFIETCDEWVVPYIGELLDVRGLLPLENATGALTQRAFVANTLAYRRRKGTAAVLEQLARDVTGWPARAVEFFARLATTQHLNHVRLASRATVDVRDAASLELVHGPFERATHTAEVRHIDVGRGRYNIPYIGLFLWRLQPYAMTRSTARSAATSLDPSGGRFTFSPLGNDTPLFNRPTTEREMAQLAREEHVPAPLRRRPLHDELEARRRGPGGVPGTDRYFGENPVLEVFVNGQDVPVSPENLHICHLEDWRRPTAPDEVFVDPVLGRISFAAGVTPDPVEVSYAYGFSGDIGGGPYNRQQSAAAWFTRDSREVWQMGVTRDAPAGDSRLVGTVTEAVQAWNSLPASAGGRIGLITIMDSRSYHEDHTGAQAIEIPPGSQLAIVAADWPGTPAPDVPGGRRRVAGQFIPANLRPHLHGNLEVRGGAAEGEAVAGELVLDGLLIEGALTVAAGNLGSLRIAHCTLVPGLGLAADGRPVDPARPSLVVDASNTRLRLLLDHSITGPLHLPPVMTAVDVRDSIIDSPARGGRAGLWPVLVSGEPAGDDLSSDNPAVQVTIGDEGPSTATFLAKPANLAETRTLLELAIRAANPSLAFARARVIVVPGTNRLAILPGAAGAVAIDNAGADPTATELGLDRRSARQALALIGGRLPAFAGLSAAAPALHVTIGDEGPHRVSLAGGPTTLEEARQQLQSAIQSVSSVTGAFAGTLVATFGDRLVVLPGIANRAATFDAVADDQTTLLELALERDRPAIAANAAGDRPAPPATIERATILGRISVTELRLASETIFSDPPEAERRQVGCVRFSYVPAGARTPPRYRCQPDLAIAARVAAAEERAAAEGRTLFPAEREAVRDSVQRALVPSFTTTRYGRPGYGQLGPTCPEPIRTGAEDEGEMGAFHFLHQARRLKNLQASLDEYLRFGLEAGVFLVT